MRHGALTTYHLVAPWRKCYIYSMKVFFCASSNFQIHLKAAYDSIIQVVETRGDELENSWVVEYLKGASVSYSSRELLLRQNKLVQQADCVIIEASTPSFGVGYLLAQALQLHKPILCLFPAKGNTELLSDGIKGNASSLITLKLYEITDLKEIINSYLDGLDLNSLVKFNFVANKQVVDFLKTGAAQEGVSMSEYLRNLIENDYIKHR